MLWLKGCPRCIKGDMVLDRDFWGWYRHCLRCGYLEDLPEHRVEARGASPTIPEQAFYGSGSRGN